MKFTRTLLFFCLFIFSWQATANEKDWFFKPYVGIDLGAQRLEWESGFGENHFKEHYPYANFHAGVLLHEYLGLEFGYEHMFAQMRTQYYGQTPATPVLGFTSFGAAGPQSYASSAHINGFNFNVLLTYPILEKTTIFAILGANWARLHVSTKPSDNTVANRRTVYWHSDRHAIGRFGFGIRHNILPNFGGRLAYLWENTSKLDANIFPGGDIAAVTTPTSTGHLYTVKPKNSHILMASLFYQGDWA